MTTSHRRDVARPTVAVSTASHFGRVCILNVFAPGPRDPSLSHCPRCMPRMYAEHHARHRADRPVDAPSLTVPASLLGLPVATDARVPRAQVIVMHTAAPPPSADIATYIRERAEFRASIGLRP